MIKVLVIDDEEIVRRSIANALLNRDYMVLQAKSGLVALKMCEIERPDVILLDIMMPEMDGFEVVEKLRENPDTKEIPVVIVSALSEKEVKQGGEAVRGQTPHQQALDGRQPGRHHPASYRHQRPPLGTGGISLFRSGWHREVKG